MTSRRQTVVPVERISCAILMLRGHRVILDSELAAIHGVETRVLNQAVRRNAERFPVDFRFQLAATEAAASRSQSVTLKPGRGLNIKFLPYAFTEHGAIMVATVLSSPHTTRPSRPCFPRSANSCNRQLPSAAASVSPPTSNGEIGVHANTHIDRSTGQPSLRLRQRRIEDFDPMPDRCRGAGLQVIDAADIG